ncbi:unnamed protein product [Choristocarpus tenellus]
MASLQTPTMKLFQRTVQRHPLGVRRLLSGGNPSVSSATASQVGIGSRGPEPLSPAGKVWLFIKGSKQQFFNLSFATLGLMMASRMINAKGERLELEERLSEMKEREKSFLSSVADETWAEVSTVIYFIKVCACY